MTTWKRVLSVILALCMVSAVLPWTATPAEAAGDAQEGETIQAEYTVSDISAAGDLVSVGLTAPADCLLVVALYSEGGAMISTAMEEVGGQSAPQIIPVTVDPGENTAYTARAFLLDPTSYAPLDKSRSISYEGLELPEEFQDPTATSVSFDKSSSRCYVNNDLLVFLEPDASPSEIDRVAEAANGRVVGWDARLNLYQLRVPSGDLAELNALGSELEDRFSCVGDTTCNYVYLDGLCSVTPVTPNDPWNGDVDTVDWQNTDIDGSNWWVEAVEGQQAWAYSGQFCPVDVGVIDVSFDVGHEDLENQYTFLPYNGSSSDGDKRGYEERNDMTPWYNDWDVGKELVKDWDAIKDGFLAQKNVHGTHVAGIIGAAGDNSKGITGLAPNADLVLAPVPTKSVADVYNAVSDLAGYGVRVISLSMGVSAMIPSGQSSHSEEDIRNDAGIFARLMDTLLGRGLDFLVVQSAGNGNADEVAVDARYNGMFAGITVDTPLDGGSVSIQDVLDHIIIVGAAEQSESGYQCGSYSNFGSQVDICAPGSGVYSALPGDMLTGFEFTGGYGTMSGTSQAAPIVAAICAMTWGVREDLTGAQVRDIVCSATKDVVEPHPDSGDNTSYPMVNARLAVERALEYTEKTVPVTVRVKLEDGTPVSRALIKNTGLDSDPRTGVDGSTVFFLKTGNYKLTCRPYLEGSCYYAERVLTIREATTIELTLKPEYFSYDLDGDHLNIEGWGPMSNYSQNKAPWDKYDFTSVSVTGLASVGKNAFYTCDGLTKVTLDETVTAIGENAFYTCEALEEINIPDFVTDIGSYAFYQCVNLGDMEIPDFVRSIGEKTFMYCSKGLTEITIGDSVTSIGYNAFNSCQALKKVTLGANLTSIGDQAFFACRKLEEILIPHKVKTIGSSAFESCQSLKYAQIGNGVTSIGASAFDYCKALTTVTMGSSVTTIEASAFEACSALQQMILPDSLTTLGERAFFQCTALEEVQFGKGLVSLGSHAFYSCTSLKKAELQDGVQTIGSSAFSSCSALTTVYIPKTVRSIGDYAFYYNSKLTDLFYSGSEEDWSKVTLGKNALPNGVAPQYNYTP